MIPRVTRRIETTLVSSRQSLPRPARLYSTPSKKLNAPALATVLPPKLAYIPPPNQKQFTNSQIPEVESFLSRPTPYTVLPTPLPIDQTSDEQHQWFANTAQQDQVAIIDACLHGQYDVPRAKGVFDRLRQTPGNPILSTQVYNAVLEAYLNMATTKDRKDKAYWVSNAWKLYSSMESGTDKFDPDAGTYAILLVFDQRFGPSSPDCVDIDGTRSAAELLVKLVDRKVNLPSVIGHRAFATSEEAADVIKRLTKAAVDENIPEVLSELGQTHNLGTLAPDKLKDVPDVKPVMRARKTKTGESDELEIPFNLDVLRRHLAEAALARRILGDDVASRQKLLEESVYEVAVERLKQQADTMTSLGIGGNFSQPDLRRWMWEWHTKLRDRLTAEIEAISEVEARGRSGDGALSPYLSLVKAERLSLITIFEIMRLHGSGGITDGMKTTRALVSVGRAVELEYKAQMCKTHHIYIPTTAKMSDSFFSNLGYKNLQERRVAAAKHMVDGEAWTATWSQAVRSKVGGILVECLMDVAEVTRTAVDKTTGKPVSEVQPAIIHGYEYARGQKLGILRLNPIVAERLANDTVKEILHPRHLPMLVRPKPWIDYNVGGYLYNQNNAMRFKDSLEQQNYLKQASDHGRVELVYAGLDVLGRTPWRINQPIFDVVLKVWNSGTRMGKLPPVVYDVPEPTPPDNYETDLKARSVHIIRQKTYQNAKANNHSDRCSVNYKIEIARAFLADTFFLPHNLDFRGRAYPIPPHLNHIGDDLCRGLLRFADARPLGERGMRWLKIHLANLYGYDKASFDERLQWTMEHLDDIYDSAINPLEGRRWWATAGDPWQCLATCIELHAALESPNPYEFESSLPVHQDGTCNGLQHYAALGGDAQGAQQVNLASGDRPSDVYTHVGDMVERLLKVDVDKGHKYAKMLQGKISRKVVKQTVMTTVYGVTFVGARDQIEKQLKDRKDIPDEECWLAASYLAKLVLACIGDLFSGANAIQSWLNLCARLISKSIQPSRLHEVFTQAEGRKGGGIKSSTRLKKEQMTSVIWTTPLGLPIVQPYRKIARKQVMTAVQSVYISDPNTPAEVNSLKQASAFPPNFIHSLDATHMMLTALKCDELGLTFASVHDSYWTHACDIDTMSSVIRDTFIALHSSDVLGKLREEFVERYKGYKVPLVSLRGLGMLKALKAAGTRIIATPEQADSLNCLGDLVTVSTSEKPMVDESNAPESMKHVDALLAELELSQQEDGDDDLRTARQLQQREADAKATKELAGKFVNLTDLLPPLPKKGSFKVEAIKASQYFFS